MERTFIIKTRNEQQLDIIEQLLLHIEYLGKVGASRNLLVRVDGDGSAQISIKDKDDLYVSDYKKLKIEEPTEQKSLNTVVSGIYDLD